MKYVNTPLFYHYNSVVFYIRKIHLCDKQIIILHETLYIAIYYINLVLHKNCIRKITIIIN